MAVERKKSEITAIKIQKAILDGRYSPGDRLPPERKLAEEYGVSRSIVREAVRHLSGIGLVRTEAQSGTYVSDYSQEASLEFLIYLLDNNETLNPEIFRSLLDFRELLEVGAAGTAAGLADEKFSDGLRTQLGKMKAEREDPLHLTELDFQFHRMIISRTGNIAFKLLFNACRSVYMFYAGEFYRQEHNIDHTFFQLERLIGAMDERDGPAASAIMKEALTYGRDSIYKSLGITAFPENNKTGEENGGEFKIGKGG